MPIHDADDGGPRTSREPIAPAGLDELERRYDIDASVPQREAILARVGTLNLWARHGLTADLGVRYGDTPEERLDVFHGKPDGPVVVFLHGGHWTSNSAEDFSFVALGPAVAGATVVVTNYALCPAVTIAEITRQHGAAVGWTRRHIGDYGADPDRIAVVGHSAGGHGAAMLASTDWPSERGLGADSVKGIAPSADCSTYARWLKPTIASSCT